MQILELSLSQYLSPRKWPCMKIGIRCKLMKFSTFPWADKVPQI